MAEINGKAKKRMQPYFIRVTMEPSMLDDDWIEMNFSIGIDHATLQAKEIAKRSLVTPCLDLLFDSVKRKFAKALKQYEEDKPVTGGIRLVKKDVK